MMNSIRAKILLVFALSFVFISLTEAHSWVACTDYKISSDSDRNYWDASKCRAYPRNWQSVASAIFGEDRGYNFQGTETQTCRDPIGAGPSYGYSTYPMAQYSPGQTVCLAWPSKNHVAATCTNPYIPDTSLQIFASGPNPTSDPSQTQFKQTVVNSAVNGVHQNGVIDLKGFQNCPKFCENMDKSLCTGCFTVPTNFQVGAVYTFQWYWIFNPGSAPYTTCWEAKIVSGSGSASSSSSSSATSTSTSTSSSTSSSSSTSGTSGSNTGVLPYRGVNEAGAEFGSIGGAYGTAYTYPTAQSVDYFVNKGMNTFRFPFMWERVQTSLFGTLDATEMGRMDTFINYVTNTKGKYLVLDPHNYARYQGNVIGEAGSPVTVDSFKNLWTQLANRYKNNPRVIFGLMNEPNTMSTTLWRDDANAAIAAIRATGATNLILVPGNAWTGGHSWTQTWYGGGVSNAVAMTGIVDSRNNFAFDIHQYLDADSSGTSATCVSATIGSERLQEVTNWMRSNGKKAFLGEFGGSSSGTCLSALDNMLSFLERNSDVWIGWAFWAAGPWWGEYMYTLEPSSAGDRPQMAALSTHLTGSSTSGTSTTTTGSGTTSSPCKRSISADTVIIVGAPTAIASQGSSFVVDVAYSTEDARDIVVLVSDSEGNEYGREVVTVADKGAVSIAVSMYKQPALGKTLKLSATIVPAGYTNTDGQELDVQEILVPVGQNVTYPETGISLGKVTFLLSNTANNIVPSLLGLLALCVATAYMF